MLENYIEILVVDDDINILKTLSEYLINENGFDATFVDDGAVAIKFLEIKQFDVVLTDIMMPVTNGIQLIEELREFNKNTPVIAMYIKEMENYESEMIELSQYLADRVLQKPFTKHQLVQTLEEILNMRINSMMETLQS